MIARDPEKLRLATRDYMGMPAVHMGREAIEAKLQNR